MKDILLVLSFILCLVGGLGFLMSAFSKFSRKDKILYLRRTRASFLKDADSGDRIYDGPAYELKESDNSKKMKRFFKVLSSGIIILVYTYFKYR